MDRHIRLIRRTLGLHENAIKAVRLLQEVYQSLIIPRVSNLLCGVFEPDNKQKLNKYV